VVFGATVGIIGLIWKGSFLLGIIVFLAMFFNMVAAAAAGVLIPLALFGVLGLAAVVLVHEVAEVFVIANGVRAGRTTHLPTLTALADRPAEQGATA